MVTEQAAQKTSKPHKKATKRDLGIIVCLCCIMLIATVVRYAALWTNTANPLAAVEEWVCLFGLAGFIYGAILLVVRRKDLPSGAFRIIAIASVVLLPVLLALYVPLLFGSRGNIAGATTTASPARHVSTSTPATNVSSAGLSSGMVVIDDSVNGFSLEVPLQWKLNRQVKEAVGATQLFAATAVKPDPFSMVNVIKCPVPAQVSTVADYVKQVVAQVTADPSGPRILDHGTLMLGNEAVGFTKIKAQMSPEVTAEMTQYYFVRGQTIFTLGIFQDASNPRPELTAKITNSFKCREVR